MNFLNRDDLLTEIGCGRIRRIKYFRENHSADSFYITYYGYREGESIPSYCYGGEFADKGKMRAFNKGLSNAGASVRKAWFRPEI